MLGPQLGNIKLGDSFNLQPVATAVTDSSGKYVVRLASSSLISPMASPDGIVNLEARTTDVASGKMASYSFSVGIAPSETGIVLATPESAIELNRSRTIVTGANRTPPPRNADC